MNLIPLIRTTGWALLATLSLSFSSAYAVEYRGIEFPEGAISFADSLLKYDALHTGGPAPTDPNFTDPNASLGVPDPSSVSLGRGGLIELAFVDNLLTSSGSSDDDLHIFEIGPDVEDTFVAIRPTAATLLLLDPAADSNGDGFFEIGKVFGSTSSIDIDSFFTGHAAGELTFDAVQLIDDRNEGNSGGSTVGADIDAVGAIASVVVPEPSGAVLLLLGVAWTMRIRRKR